MNYTKRLITQLAASVALFTLAATGSTSALANCWHDAELTQRTHHHAQRGFPASAARLPVVLLCITEVFLPGVGGDYTGGIHRIRIPVWKMQSGDLDSTIRHELGHSEVALTGQDDGRYGGHGPAWMRIMQAAGDGHEAQRMAEHYGTTVPNGPAMGNSGGNAYGNSGQQPGRQPVCTRERVQVDLGHDGYGNRVIGFQIRSRCWTQ